MEKRLKERGAKGYGPLTPLSKERLRLSLLELSNNDPIAWCFGIGEELNFCNKQAQIPLVVNDETVKKTRVSAWWISKCSNPLANFIGPIDNCRNHKWISVKICRSTFRNRERIANLSYYASKVDWVLLIVEAKY